jgi:hypothetical protein
MRAGVLFPPYETHFNDQIGDVQSKVAQKVVGKPTNNEMGAKMPAAAVSW